MTLETLDLKVEPLEYFFENTASDSNTVLVLPSETEFLTDRRQLKNTRENNFEDITLETVAYKVIPFWNFSEKHCFDSNTVLVLLSKAVF